MPSAGDICFAVLMILFACWLDKKDPGPGNFEARPEKHDTSLSPVIYFVGVVVVVVIFLAIFGDYKPWMWAANGNTPSGQ